jgi:hypothetical protein
MFSLQHVFALWVLAHMLWAAVSLEREWRRIRSSDDLAHRQRLQNMPRGLAAAEPSQSNTRQ